MATDIVRVKGVPVQFAGGARIVPPLSLASVEALQDRLSNYSGTIADVSVVIDALHHALKRNYPDITRDEAGELVDMANIEQVFAAVMNVSGLTPTDQVESSGEAQAAQ